MLASGSTAGATPFCHTFGQLPHTAHRCSPFAHQVCCRRRQRSVIQLQIPLQNAVKLLRPQGPKPDRGTPWRLRGRPCGARHPRFITGLAKRLHTSLKYVFLLWECRSHESGVGNNCRLPLGLTTQPFWAQTSLNFGLPTVSTRRTTARCLAPRSILVSIRTTLLATALTDTCDFCTIYHITSSHIACCIEFGKVVVALTPLRQRRSDNKGML